jgi:ribulose-phosphate 3-epimerase
VTRGRVLVAASILNADLGNLAHAVRRAERAGVDRIHLDVMDGHFVPNMTFGAATVAALRGVTRLPFDAHLMISEPSRYVGAFIDAGCDSITIHVEVGEPVEPTLRAIRGAGRAAGLALRPATPLAALEPYREDLDIVMVMTVEPGFGGQAFLREPARKLLDARRLVDHRPWSGELHADGGVNRETAEYVGSLGADVLVVGSALFRKGADPARETRLVRSLAEEGFAHAFRGERPPAPRDRWVRIVTLPRAVGSGLARRLEDDGIPVIFLRGDGPIGPDGVREYDVLVPVAAEPLVRERHAGSLEAADDAASLQRAGGTASASPSEAAADPGPRPPRGRHAAGKTEGPA